MRIAINTRFLLSGKLEGIGMYTQEIFKRVVQQMPEHEFYFLFDRPFSDEFIFAKNVIPLVVSPPARHPFLWYWWFEKSIPKILKKHKIDLFISPDGYCSLNTTIPQILTIHDLGFEHFPMHVPFLVRNYYQYFTPKYCEKSAKIFIGAVHPRKNVLNLLKAFEVFKSKNNTTHQLIIIGRNAWMNAELKNYLTEMQFKKDVIWLENCERNKLLEILQNAIAFVYPSLFEGFGIPIIEAMSIGVPVITSNTSAMTEIAGNAALLVNPTNTNEIADAMQLIITDEVLRIGLIEKGRANAVRFSWQQSAEKVMEIIQQFKL